MVFFFIVGNLHLIQFHDISVILSEMEIHFTVFQTALANVFIHVQMYDQMLFAMFCIAFTLLNDLKELAVIFMKDHIKY